MLITKNNGDDAFVRRVDAESRVTVWAVNRANSPLISKLGLTHVPGGAVDTSGMKMLHSNGPGLTLEKNSVEGLGFVPVGESSTLITPMAPSVFARRQLFDITPDNVSLALNEMTNGNNPVFAAKGLRLINRDMDNVSGPKLCRAFCDPLVPVAGLFNMECCDAGGNFTGRYVLFNGSVFEAKFYKYTDSPYGAYFGFAPRKSAIYAPAGCDGTFTTNANIAIRNPGKGWLCTAGGEDKLDWDIIRRYGENSTIIWASFLDDMFLSENNFAEAFTIATEAKRRCIKLKFLQAQATFQSIGGAYAAQESLLNDREIRKVARRYNLKIDPVWNGLPGEIVFDDEPLVREVPPFWKGNRITVFFGKTSGEFMMELVIPRIMPWIDCGRVLVIIDEKDRKLAQQVHTAGGSNVRAASFDVLFEDEHVFLEKVPSQADMIFLVPPHTDDGKEKVIDPAILNVCAQAKLPVGIFSRSKDAPQRETASDTVLYCVAKSQSDGGSVFAVKNMETNIITNYKFSTAGVTENPGTENDMKEQM